MARGPKRKPRAKSGLEKRRAVSLTLSPEVSAGLEAARAKSGRSFSAEADFRLEIALREQRSIADALDFNYGLQASGLLQLLGDLATDGDNWLNNPGHFERMRRKVALVFEALSPGQPTAQELARADADNAYVGMPGITGPVTAEEEARHLLEQLVARTPDALFADWARSLWLRLGDAAVRRAMVWTGRQQ